MAYNEVRRNVILSCFFQCLKEGEVFWSHVLCVLFVLCASLMTVELVDCLTCYEYVPLEAAQHCRLVWRFLKIKVSPRQKKLVSNNNFRAK